MEQSFFQSSIWRYIQEFVVVRTIFDFSFGEKSFWGIKRSKKIGPFAISWYQILGFPQEFLHDKKKLYTSFLEQVGIGFGDVFLQLGSDSVLDRFSVAELGEESFCADVLRKRKAIEKKLSQQGYRLSFRENMPLSTVLTDCDMTDEELLGQMHQMLRRNLKKTVKQGVVFSVAEEKHFESFYDLWSSVSEMKGIGIMSKTVFLELCNYLYSEDVGRLFVTLDDAGKVCAGSIVVFWNDTLIYLYGAGSREVSGSHVFVQHEVMKWGREHGYKYFDHWGSYPSGDQSHHLYGVGKFKERFGGEKIEYVGNYDLVFSDLLYSVLKKFR